MKTAHRSSDATPIAVRLRGSAGVVCNFQTINQFLFVFLTQIAIRAQRQKGMVTVCERSLGRSQGDEKAGRSVIATLSEMIKTACCCIARSDRHSSPAVIFEF